MEWNAIVLYYYIGRSSKNVSPLIGRSPKNFTILIKIISIF
jgi:hypothetical protein